MADKPPGMRVEDLIGSAASGWDFFEPKAEAKKLSDRVEQNKLDRLATIAAVMWGNDPHFRELVEFLADQTVRRPVFVSQLGLPVEEAYSYGVFREGQNGLFQVICNLIHRGQAIAAPPES